MPSRECGWHAHQETFTHPEVTYEALLVHKCMLCIGGIHSVPLLKHCSVTATRGCHTNKPPNIAGVYLKYTYLLDMVDTTCMLNIDEV